MICEILSATSPGKKSKEKKTAEKITLEHCKVLHGISILTGLKSVQLAILQEAGLQHNPKKMMIEPSLQLKSSSPFDVTLV
jgi:hypothetical protein